MSLLHVSCSKEICSENRIMCPQCDRKCDYWNFNETCVYSRLSNLFDNQITFVWAIFMSIWGKSYSLGYEWSLELVTFFNSNSLSWTMATILGKSDTFMGSHKLHKKDRTTTPTILGSLKELQGSVHERPPSTKRRRRSGAWTSSSFLEIQISSLSSQLFSHIFICKYLN